MAEMELRHLDLGDGQGQCGRIPEPELRSTDLKQVTCTVCLVNAACIPAGQALGICLCIHPFSGVIDFGGLGCNWCGQPSPSDPARYKPERTAAVNAAYPGGRWPYQDGEPRA